MSSSVAKALRLTGGDEAVETANFVEIVDKLFDCLNVSSLSKGRHQRKAFVLPYYKLNDFRIEVSNPLYIDENRLNHFCSFYAMNCFLILTSGKPVWRLGLGFQKKNATLCFYPESHGMG